MNERKLQREFNSDELFMLRALELAARGRGRVSPNPMVGCVIVKNGEIIGEGFHKQYGGPHAEVNAVNSVTDKGTLQSATAYVTLEPCSHFGKTPPCADLLVKHQLKKVVIANVDVNPLVSGKGILKLKEAGIEVATGVLAEEAAALNIRFFTFFQKHRPYVILKWAQTADGFIARSNFDSKWISNEYSRQLVHQWRAEEDAILVGTNTALHDNPKLTVRDWEGKHPTRIVIDRSLKLPSHLSVFDGSVPSLVFNTLKDEQRHNVELVRVEESDFLSVMLKKLWERKIQSLIVEGGAQTLAAFIAAGLWDEARVFESVSFFGEGIRAPRITGHLSEERFIGSDVLKVFVKT